MKKVYICGACDASFEAETTLFLTAEVTCPVCGKCHPRGEYGEINFCPHCQSELQVSLDVPPGTTVTCQDCGGEFATDRSASYEDELPVSEEPEKTAEFSAGDLFDKYEIVSLLGAGGMGEVYLARHLLLKRQCALKILKREACSDRVASARFVREAKLANRLAHPNIVAVLDVGTDFRTGRLFLAMEYVDGKNLAQLMREKGPLGEQDVLLIGNEVCKALEAMQNAGMVHRDIKPSNIMIDKAGHIKLMDLGIARSLESHEVTLTMTQDQVVFGTPGYASPEQCRSAHLADHRSDIYSLGAALFHLSCGEPPYSGKNPLDTMVHVLQDPPKDLRKLNPALSPAFVALIRAMMKKDPALRLAPASAVRRRMEKLLAGRQESPTQQFASLAAYITQNPKRKYRLLILAFILLIAAVTAIMLLSRDSDQPSIPDIQVVSTQKPAPVPAKGNTGKSVPRPVGRTANKPVVNKPVEVKPVEVKPVEVKPVEVKPVEVKPVEVKPVEVKPVEVKPVEVKPVVKAENKTEVKTPQKKEEKSVNYGALLKMFQTKKKSR